MSSRRAIPPAERRQKLLAAERATETFGRPGRHRVALGFPNSYEIGMSNLGFQWVYRLFNREDALSCERFFFDEEDLGRRDFTIHAMAVPLGPDGPGTPLLDPWCGHRDLRDRAIRLLHGRSLADDPTRAFRAARYAARLGFDLDGGFPDALRVASDRGAFARVSGDRLRRALGEVLEEENRSVALAILDRLGVPSLVVENWSIDAGTIASLGSPSSRDEAWGRLLSAGTTELRERVARRLNFSRALRRIAGCPR